MEDSHRHKMALEYSKLAVSLSCKEAAAKVRDRYQPGARLESFRIKLHKWRKKFGIQLGNKR